MEPQSPPIQQNAHWVRSELQNGKKSGESSFMYLYLFSVVTKLVALVLGSIKKHSASHLSSCGFQSPAYSQASFETGG